MDMGRMKKRRMLMVIGRGRIRMGSLVGRTVRRWNRRRRRKLRVRRKGPIEINPRLSRKCLK
jgi:hypothetical protein